MSGEKINVVVADDHYIFMEGIVSLLQSEPQISIAGMAKSGGEALVLLENNNTVKVLLSDISMPDIDGLELCKQVKKRFPYISVIALSMHDEPRIISSMLKAGAAGYLLKKTNRQELLTAIKTVLSGQSFISEEVKMAVIDGVTGNSKKTHSILPQLSPREKEVLKLVAKEHTTQEIASLLFISTHTVISHRKKLLLKFDCQNTAGLIAKAHEYGLLD